ncbi:MAG TPA: hypothetical protein VNY84_05060, partial [Acidimicrobiales bacterium]|nr:hypothetical protein [Acidimicrobiales bacterium]
MTDDPEEFDESLRRALDRMAPPAGDVEGSFGGVLAGAQRRRRQRLLLRASAVLAVAATAAAVAIVVATRPSSHSTDVATHPVTATTLVVPTVPTTLPVPTTAPVPTTVAAASCQATSPSAGPRAALDNCTLFVVTPRSTPGPNYSTVVEFDRRTGRMTRQLNLPGV